jgi:ribosomal subunit interface protein
LMILLVRLSNGLDCHKGDKMRTNISAIHFKAHDSLKEFAENEVLRLKKFSEELINCEIEYSFNKNDKTAHIHVNVNGTVLNATETSDDFIKSTTLCVDKLEMQLKKLKGKSLAKRQ